MTGRGVTVVVVDDGVEHTIKDIQPNYVSPVPAAWQEGARGNWCRSWSLSRSSAGLQPCVEPASPFP